MKAPAILALVGLALLVLEGGSLALASLASSVFAMTVPTRRKFLAEQSKGLHRLLHDPSIRSSIHPVRGWEYAHRITETEHVSPQKLRARRTYGPQPAAGLTRISAFGDSYVYGAEVTDADTWPEQIEAGWHVEVLNYGVGGYGADQTLLRFREEGGALKPHIVIFGFTTMMASRMVSRYRRFEDPRDGTLFKPRFVLENGNLQLVPTPVASREDAERLMANPMEIVEFGRNDFWYNPAVLEHRLYGWSATYRLVTCTLFRGWRRYFHPDRIHKDHVLNRGAESFRILSRVFQEFASAVRSGGAEPVVLMLPVRSDVEMYTHLGRVSYETLRDELEEKGVRVIDPIPAFTSSPMSGDELFTSGGHYAAPGNAIIAQALASALGLPTRS